MAKRKPLPELSRLEAAFLVKDDKELLWKERRAGVSTGKQAGHISSTDGYLYVCLDRTVYMVHRVLWKLLKKEEPPETLDHIDGNPLNNHISNLRECSQKQNTINRNRTKNVTGVAGVYKSNTKGKYYAQIKANDTNLYLGTFSSLEEAAAARRSAEIKYFGEFAPTQKGNNNGRD